MKDYAEDVLEYGRLERRLVLHKNCQFGCYFEEEITTMIIRNAFIK